MPPRRQMHRRIWENRRLRGPCPSLANTSEELLATRAHRADSARRSFGILVARRPQDDLHECGCQIDAFLGQAIEDAPSVRGIGLPGENAGCLQLCQAVGENVGSNAFAGRREFVERPPPLCTALTPPAGGFATTTRSASSTTIPWRAAVSTSSCTKDSSNTTARTVSSKGFSRF